jgi:hypothetical protein
VSTASYKDFGQFCHLSDLSKGLCKFLTFVGFWQSCQSPRNRRGNNALYAQWRWSPDYPEASPLRSQCRAVLSAILSGLVVSARVTCIDCWWSPGGHSPGVGWTGYGGTKTRYP